MNFPTLTEAQEQELQQLTQVQDLIASQSYYYPSQVGPYHHHQLNHQAFNQSIQPNYPFSHHYPIHHNHHQINHHHHYPIHHHFPYYHQNYPNPYQPQQLQTESILTQPPRISSWQWQNPSPSSSSFPIPNPHGLNPAAAPAPAAAALLQWNQFGGGLMGAAEKAVSGLHKRLLLHGQYSVLPGQANNGGGGTRGGEQIRGSRDHFDNHHLRADVSGSTTGIAQQSTKRPVQIVRCELCKVDCTRDTFEHHKNGKKHKKKLQRSQELQNPRNTEPISMPMVGNMPEPESSRAPGLAPNTSRGSASLQTDVPSIQNQQKPMAEGEAGTRNEDINKAEIVKHLVPENLLSDENSEQQKEMGEQSEGAARMGAGTKRKQGMDRFDNKRQDLKRQAKGSRGAKPRRGRKKELLPKGLAPLICDLCNVNSYTQDSFDYHLAGKKHLSKLKRFQSQQDKNRPVGLQVLYPPNPNAETTTTTAASEHKVVLVPVSDEMAVSISQQEKQELAQKDQQQAIATTTQSCV